MNTGNKEIIFAETAPSEMNYKIAYVLKKKGYKTILICINKLEKGVFSDAYNKIISFNFKFFKVNLRNATKIFSYSLKNLKNLASALIQIKKLKPYIVIGRATPNWLCALTRKYFKTANFIYFPYDIRSFCYRSLEEAKKGGVPLFEIKAEKYCFENADGIIHKADENELKYLDKKVLGEFEIKAPHIFFPPYCLKDLMAPANKDKLSKKDKEIHIVFVGHIGTGEWGKWWHKQIKDILNQKMHLHLYGKTAYLTKKESYNAVKENNLYQELLENKYCHLHDQMNFKELSKEISKYDFGIWLGHGMRSREKNIRFGTGNKMAAYFEAGLPFFYFKDQKSVVKLMKKYGFNLELDGNELKFLKKKINKINYKELQKKVLVAREDFEVDKHIKELEDFFKKVAENRKKS